jgi:hypothetical protein
MDLNSFDYAPAEAFGELTVIKSAPFHTGVVDPTANNEPLAQIYKQLKGYEAGSDYILDAEHAKLKVGYDPGVDYFVPTGKPVKMCVIAGIAYRYFGPKHRFLVWDQKYYRYVPYMIDVSCIEETQ